MATMKHRNSMDITEAENIKKRWQEYKMNAGDVGLIPLVGEDPLENEMATEPSILAQEMPWTEKPGRLQSIGHNLTTKAPALPSLLYGTCLGQYLVNY